MKKTPTHLVTMTEVAQRLDMNRRTVAGFRYRNGIKPTDKTEQPGSWRYDLRDFAELLWIARTP